MIIHGVKRQQGAPSYAEISPLIPLKFGNAEIGIVLLIRLLFQLCSSEVLFGCVHFAKNK